MIAHSDLIPFRIEIDCSILMWEMVFNSVQPSSTGIQHNFDFFSIMACVCIIFNWKKELDFFILLKQKFLKMIKLKLKEKKEDIIDNIKSIILSKLPRFCDEWTVNTKEKKK